MTKFADSYSVLMKYQIDGFTLDTKERTLANQANCQHIRPKTLALLLYLAERAGQVISKQELLEAVWDDVNVDDGVIFQSVREVRQLFSNQSIIQNHPRKGYEFTAQLKALNQDKISNPNQSAQKNVWLPATLILLLISLVAILYPSPNKEARFEHSILVLPIKNRVPYGENDWIYLGAMEQMIAKLKGLPSSVLVYQGTQVPRLIHMAGLEREFTSSDVAKVFNVTGASLIVETEIHGNASDYKLVYKFHVSNDVKQGVILDTSINNALTTLSAKLAEFIQHPLQRNEDLPKNEFSNALFAQAMISYESDWQTSISFFESYLALNPESVTAMIYLSKLYIWSDRLEQASQLMDRASQLANGKVQELAHISLIKGRIATKQKKWQRANHLYQEAADLIEQDPDWFLKASIAEAQGLSFLEQGLLDASSKALESALAHYQIIQTPIGINSTRLHLANTLFKKGDTGTGRNLFQQAKEDIQNTRLEFLYSMLTEYESQFASYRPNQGKT